MSNIFIHVKTKLIIFYRLMNLFLRAFASGFYWPRSVTIDIFFKINNGLNVFDCDEVINRL